MFLGDNVPITFSVSGGESIEGAIITAGGRSFRFDGPGPFVFTYQAWNQAGRLDIEAQTIGAGAVDYAASTHINVSQLDFRFPWVTPYTLQLNFEGQRAGLMVQAAGYSSMPDVTKAGSGTTYHMQSGTSSVATVSEDGVVEAKGNGKDAVVVTYRGQTVPVPVSVEIGNRRPVLSTPEAVAMLPGARQIVPLSATDPDGTAVRLSGTTLPAFATVTDSGRGTGELSLHPALTDSGHFEVVVTAVDDGNPRLEVSRVIDVVVARPPFTDDPLVAGVTVARIEHISDLRLRIDALRMYFGLPAYAWGDPTLTRQATPIRVQHIIDLRLALHQVYAAAGRTPPQYTDPSLGAGSPIRAAHIMELRAAVMALE